MAGEAPGVAARSAAARRRHPPREERGRALNLILLHPEDLQADGTALLTGRRAKHVCEVHRAQAGDTLVAGLAGGLMGEADVLEVSTERVVLRPRLERQPPPTPGIDLLLALPRPKILRKVLHEAASLGVKRIVLVNSARVEKSYFDSPLLQPEETREYLELGLEQARDTVFPEVLIRQRFRPFVEDELLSLWPAEVQKLLPHPTAAQRLEQCRVGRPPSRAVVAIGPEGGWVPFEVALLEQHGFQPFSLGERILRVDAAVPVILAQVELARRVLG